ncbi:MAG: CotH kinase family protein [Paludibacteraceae bacterium]|nr:CotH kinase family protein [Paludibacteraceae bacterium]
MKNTFLTLIMLFYGLFIYSNSIYNSIQIIKTDNSQITYPIAWSDSVISNNSNQTLFLSIPTSEIKEIIYPYIIAENEINLSANDKKSFFNQLFSVSLKQNKNYQLNCDYTIEFNENSATFILSYLTDFTAIVPEFNCFGAYIFVNGKLFKNGEESIDFSNPAEIKIVSYSGDIQTYSLSIKNSALPLVTLQSTENENEEITTEWKENFMFVATNANGKKDCNGLSEFRGRGNNFAPDKKNRYGIKLEEKTKILDMPKGKRWITLPCDNDKSLLRAELGFYIYKNFLGSCWTPNYRACELIINNTHKGSYLLTEQIRITDERISSGLILSIENDADEDDDSFFSSISKSLFVFQDPDAGAIGTKMIRTQVLIDKFESLLYSDNSNDNNKAIELINKESFIDWMIFNEIAKNENAFSKDCYLNISTENIISMGPIWDMSDYFGLKSNDSHEDFVVINHGWVKQLLKDMSFSTSLHKRFQVIYNQKNAILNWIDEEAKKKLPSAFSNELLHNNFDEKPNNYSSFSEKYLEEVEQLKLWIDARLEWLNTALR